MVEEWREARPLLPPAPTKPSPKVIDRANCGAKQWAGENLRGAWDAVTKESSAGSL
jgi:hypothetical protein